MMDWVSRCLILVMAALSVAAAPAWAQSDGDAAIELSGFSVSEAFDLNAGDRMDLSDPQFLKLLFRSGKVSAVNFKKWAKFAADVSWPQLIDVPHRYRFWTFNRNLMLTRLVQIRLSNDEGGGDLKGVYLAHCESDSGQPVFLITRSAPRKIALDQPIRQPISFVGFYYNNVAAGPRGELLRSTGENSDDGDSDADDRNTDDRDGDSSVGAGQGGFDEAKEQAKEDDGGGRDVGREGDGRLEDADAADGDRGESVPLFVANRFAWHPVESTPTMNVSRGQLELSTRGVDVGLFDYVRKQNSKPLSQYDADAFYQMLAAVADRGNSATPLTDPKADSADDAEISFTELMAAPARHFGGAIAMSGRLRQCVPIEITNDDRQSQVGALRYYQASLFPDLGGRDVVVRGSGGQSVKFEQFPVTICVAELPDGFTPQSLEGRAVEVRGYFYRFIKYQSKVSAAASVSGQVSPLVMVSEMVVAPAVTSAKGVDLLMRTLLLLILAGVVAAIVWGIFKDRIRSRGGMAENVDALPEKIDVSQFED